jgi:hypothetical protein
MRTGMQARTAKSSLASFIKKEHLSKAGGNDESLEIGYRKMPVALASSTVSLSIALWLELLVADPVFITAISHQFTQLFNTKICHFVHANQQ